ncbi:MAG: sugar nucleotide-binding protein, partial [Smithellaceae bacterium]|nr:sugar nucleotide-binding protein [Smithellaceae bacterium]
ETIVTPIKSNELSGPAIRPAYSVLSSRKFMEQTGRAMPFWQIALQDYLDKVSYLKLQGGIEGGPK